MISVIIPTFNEADTIARAIEKIRLANKNYEIEIIVVDGGSTDQTVSIVKKLGNTIISSPKGRAVQMNRGAKAANSKTLYFLHADSIPPSNFAAYISGAILSGAVSGCFRLRFDLNHWFLRANCWFTRFDLNVFRFGDQSLFVLKDIFDQAGGFREDLLLMEDQEIINRIKKHGGFIVMNAIIITSARKYLDNGVFRMQAIFFLIWFLYYLGCTQRFLLKLYKMLIKKHKL